MSRSTQSLVRVALVVLPLLGGCTDRGPEGLVSDAVSSRTSRREAALERLQRGDAGQEVIAGLTEVLGSSDADRVHWAVEALVAAGDPATVPALIDLSRRVEGPFMLYVVRAIGDIGGRQAEGYLFTLETGSPDEAVRGAARQARETLDRRREASARAEAAKGA